jgi:lipopolysaccharide heptosyltransferase II
MIRLHHKPKKILIMNIFGLGDVLFTTPLISNLKASFPSCTIDYLCNRRAVSIVEHNKNVERIFVYERDEFETVKQSSRAAFFKKLFGLIQDIRKEGYDTCLDVSLNSFTSFLAWFAGIPHRIGLNYKNRSFLLTQKFPIKGYEGKHVVEYYLELLNQIGIAHPKKALELAIPEKDEKWADDLWLKEELSGQKVIAIAPGGGDSWGKDALFKRWSPEKYAKLADKIIEKTKAVIILLGGQKEAELCHEVQKIMQHPAKSFCGQTTVAQFASLVKRADLVILNDGGPLHISVAAGAKTVSIFGPVDENVYGPYPREKHEVVTAAVPCRPCYRKFRRADCAHISCLNLISVEDVLRKVEEVL